MNKEKSNDKNNRDLGDYEFVIENDVKYQPKP